MEKLELVKKEKDFDFFEFYKKNKILIYSVLFYSAGVLSGAFIYIKCKSDVLNSLFEVSQNSYVQDLINSLSYYLLLFAVSVILGICLIGFPFINLIPFAVGFQTGMEITYYYLVFSLKGFGYALLMIAPFVCLFLTVILQSITKSYTLSRNIYDIAIKKSDIAEELNYKLYLKSFLIYALIIILIALINTAITHALSTIISL